MLKSYKYRIYPTTIQKIKLAKTFGCARFIWNKNVETFNNRSDFKSTTEYRKEYEFLKEVSAGAIQQKENDFKELKNQKFSKSRKKKIGNPKFKSKYDKQSFRLPNQKFYIKNNKIQIEKIGKVKIVIDREYIGRTMSVTVSKDKCGDYYASILVETEIEHKAKTGNSVGVDVGLKELIVTSDGLSMKNLPNNQTKIKHIQRHLSRKVKGSNRYYKIKYRFAKLNRKENRRKDWYLHNISSFLVNNYDVIVTEDLNVQGMMKNHKLAGSIGRASWTKLINQIQYKCDWYGKELIKINRFFPSSKTCNNCGTIKEDLTLKDRIFKCECGYVCDRDLNAAKNIKAVGVTTAQQSAMECNTPIGKPSKAIPNDLITYL